MSFYLICAWYFYYPDSGIGNIKGVVIGDYEQAKNALDDYKKENPYYDRYEIYHSNELPIIWCQQ